MNNEVIQLSDERIRAFIKAKKKVQVGDFITSERNENNDCFIIEFRNNNPPIIVVHPKHYDRYVAGVTYMSSAWKYAFATQEMIDEVMGKVEVKLGDEVYVSDKSEEDAIKNKKKRTFILSKVGYHYTLADGERANYENGSETLVLHKWYYIVPVTSVKEKPLEVTLDQIAEKFGVSAVKIKK